MSAHEMDSCTSSDALLMNIACYPGAISGGLSTLLGVADGDVPHFGVAGAVPLADGSVDSTEVDMRIGDTNFEAKLTETSFTTKSLAAVERYADLDQVFVREAMPKADGDSRDASAYASYQLIRNVLAVARNPAARFVVLLDGRRPDLLHEWWRVYGAIRDADLRARCGFALWQELAAVAPAPLREFLATKYGL
ncbi:PGN_0703 family putative restriction endonuclease [Gemmatimonas sp.]|uniref:PGN_0703 family putative restriction endonuclease n=1 Tax=Gemmatimonas sp. TaxID=1962908 RepID=UPI002EDA2C1C